MFDDLQSKKKYQLILLVVGFLPLVSSSTTNDLILLDETCPYCRMDLIRQQAKRITGVWDIEDLKEFGRESKLCPYVFSSLRNHS